jgi:protein Jumonji
VFHPTEKEFNDPIEYLEKIAPECERFGICRIVPPSSFKPECEVSDAMRFTAYNQYIHRMFRRKGPNSRQWDAFNRHLTSLNIDCTPFPCIGGIEVDLPGLYQAVEQLGGPMKVLEKNLWPKVSDMLKVR